MVLRHELETVVLAVIDQRSSLDSLHDWLADHVQDVADAGDADTEELANVAWVLIAEFDLGHRERKDVLVELRHALSTHKDLIDIKHDTRPLVVSGGDGKVPL